MKIRISYSNLNFLEALASWLVENDFLHEAQVINSQSIYNKRIVPLKELRKGHKKNDLVTVHHKTSEDKVTIGMDKSIRDTHLVFVYLSDSLSSAVTLCDQLYNLCPDDCEFSEITYLGVLQMRALRRNLKIYNFSEELGLSCPWYIIAREEIFFKYFHRPNEKMPFFKLESKFEGSYSITFWKNQETITKENENRIKSVFQYLNPPKETEAGNTEFVTGQSLNYTERISAHFNKLEKLFGIPGVGDESKTDAWWEFKLMDGTRGEIHNYKDGKNYLGAEGTATENISSWTIRASDKTKMIKLLDFLRENKVLIG